MWVLTCSANSVKINLVTWEDNLPVSIKTKNSHILSPIEPISMK